jgi:type IV pilus assembly protein PilA
MRPVGDHREQQDCSSDGFTLVELMVALVVVGVLLGVALPTFLGTRAGANDQAAKSAAMAGLKAVQVTKTDIEKPVDPIAAAEEAEPTVRFAELVDPAEDVPDVLGVVYVRSEAGVVTLVSRSKSGRCYWARHEDEGASFAENDCTPSPEFTTSW